jgi:hypothetical protein
VDKLLKTEANYAGRISAGRWKRTGFEMSFLRESGKGYFRICYNLICDRGLAELQNKGHKSEALSGVFESDTTSLYKGFYIQELGLTGVGG